MSADNYTTCPRCEAIQEKAKKEAQESYGTVSEEEYLHLVEKSKPKKDEDTLREDYEIGIYNGKFYIRYEGACSQCSFFYVYKRTYKFNHETNKFEEN